MAARTCIWRALPIAPTLLTISLIGGSTGCEDVPGPPRYSRSLWGDVDLPPGDEVPPSAPEYSTEPPGDGVFGGPTAHAVEAQVLEALHKRGDHPQGDTRLGAVARWRLYRAVRGTAADAAAVDAAARRVGWMGGTPWITIFRGRRDASRPIADVELEQQLAGLPANWPVSRYGISTVVHGEEIGVAIAMHSLEVSLRPVHKRVAVNDQVVLAGTLAERFQRAHFAVTLPGGAVRTWESDGRELNGTLTVSGSGVHRIEVLGDGPSGPVVVANFPIYAAIDEPAIPAPVPAPLPSEVPPGENATGVEATMLALLNAARSAAHVQAVQADVALAGAARAHSADMHDHRFMGHVSPTTGTTGDRLRAAHLLYSANGENVAEDGSAKEAHEALMESPGHRAAMLDPDFTHVGIGAAVGRSPAGDPDVFVTMEFAREQPVAIEDVPRLVVEASDSARSRDPKLRLDDSLSEAARQGAALLASDPSTPVAHAMDVTLAAAVRGRKTYPARCVVVVKSNDVGHFDPPAPAKAAHAERIGVAAVRDPDGPDAFDIVILIEAAPKLDLPCH